MGWDGRLGHRQQQSLLCVLPRVGSDSRWCLQVPRGHTGIRAHGTRREPAGGDRPRAVYRHCSALFMARWYTTTLLWTLADDSDESTLALCRSLFPSAESEAAGLRRQTSAGLAPSLRWEDASVWTAATLPLRVHAATFSASIDPAGTLGCGVVVTFGGVWIVGIQPARRASWLTDS